MKKLTKQSRVTFVELPPTQFGILNGKLDHDVYSLVKCPSRAIPQLRAVLIKDGWKNTHEINPYYHGNNGKLTSENMKDIFNSDLLLISAITRTAPQSQKLAEIYKEKNPEGIIIVGGPDPTARIEEWLEYVDIVVIGEGEKTLKDLMNKLIKNKNNLKNIKGIAYKKKGKIIVNSSRELLTEEELSELPYPIYDEVVVKGIDTGVIETTRGCPHGCEFCSVSAIYGRKYRKKSPEYIFNILKKVNGLGKRTFFIDDNLVAAGTSQDIERVNSITKTGLYKKSRIAQVTINAARNDKLLEALKKAGINLLCVGIESLSDDTLKDFDKPFTAEKNKEAIKKFRKAGFSVHGMMIIGGDGDTPESLKETSKWINENLDTVQLSPPIPLPGTKFYDRMEKEGRLLTKDWFLYGVQNLVIKPKNFTPYELQTTISKMYRDFYSIKNIGKKIKTSPDKLFNIIISLLANAPFIGLINKSLNSPTAKAHLEFLKGVS